MPLNLFPVRVPIGKAAAQDGRQLDVLMTPEFARALTDLLERIGGPNGASTTELAKMIKELQAQATTLIEQITVLFEQTQALADEIENQTVVLASQPERAPGTSDDDLALACMTPTPRDLSQALADLALLAAMQVTRPAIRRNTVTGSRGGNAALASLLTALDDSGVIINSTTT